ncbi:hypothetical protein F5I97DRAFT_1870971 [Phlebopus sp. FC_14]|nr:hypothetical protein F5I97DRAFT_1870971 [Phlebopus sp. FC_14]
MSSNGQRNDSHSPTRPFSPSTNNVLHTDARSSMDSEPSTGTGTSSPSLLGVNGRAHTSHDDDDRDLSPLELLQKQLEREREEKENLASQYRNLLAKLTTMRTTLGNKLKQDAEELDRREQHIQQLVLQNEDLASTVDTLKAELIASHEESERSSKELDSIRSRALDENAQEAAARERQLRETVGELEQCRMDRDEWERTSMQDKMAAEEARSAIEALRRDLELEREARERQSRELETATKTSSNLQSVLEDFQAAREHELHQAVKGYRMQLDEVTSSLAEYKRRALDAEVQLNENKSNASRTQELEQDVKEKNLLIGKLRHEAVIINEHLMEALRRLRKSPTDTNVDRRLVTNVLLSFLCTPRADPKRFEMLGLLATILSWTDAEREKAGLQRAAATSSSGTGTGRLFWGRGTGSPSKSKNMELEKTDETESFSRLWVEFLLTEAKQGESQPLPTPEAHSHPSRPSHSPSRPGPYLSPNSASRISLAQSSPTDLKGTRRLASFTNMSSAGTASSPTLSLAAPPLSRKGKEKELYS